MTLSPTISANTCSNPPCILWGVSLSSFVGGCILIVVGLFARLVVRLLLVVLGLILRRWGRAHWSHSINTLLVSSTWFLRLGCFYGAFVLISGDSKDSQSNTAINALYYVFTIPFCIAWFWWSYAFLAVVSKIVVEEYTDIQSNKEAKQRRLTESTSSSKTSMLMALQAASQRMNPKNKTPNSRATSLNQVLLILRVMIMIVVLAMICTVLRVSFTTTLNRTAIWFFPIILALIPHFRSIYYGILLMFLYSDDEWNCVQSNNWCELNGVRGETIESSLARVILAQHDSGGVRTFAPLNYFMDQGAATEVQGEVNSFVCLTVHLKPGLDADAMREVKEKTERYLSSIHPSLATFHNSSASSATFDVVNNQLKSFVGIKCTQATREILRNSLIGGLYDALGTSFTSSLDEGLHTNVRGMPFLRGIPETKECDVASGYEYTLIAEKRNFRDVTEKPLWRPPFKHLAATEPVTYDM